MTTNEKIARWLGWRGFQRQLCSGGGKTWEGDLLGVPPDSERGRLVPRFDTDIGFWHGGGELLEEIEKRGIRDQFLSALFRDFANQGISGDDYTWWMMTASPAQLAAALVAVIEGAI